MYARHTDQQLDYITANILYIGTRDILSQSAVDSFQLQQLVFFLRNRILQLTRAGSMAINQTVETITRNDAGKLYDKIRTLEVSDRTIPPNKRSRQTLTSNQALAMSAPLIQTPDD